LTRRLPSCTTVTSNRFHHHACCAPLSRARRSLLAACGGGDDTAQSTLPASGIDLQVVAFGTSLTDAGTYAPIVGGMFGGGRFTTNPGQVWAQNVSEYFGHALTPAFVGGFGLQLHALDGLDYAQGGAQVSLGGNAQATLAPEMPVTWQIQQYLQQHGNFNANQLVLVEGGANEILNFAQDPSFAAFGAAVAQNQAALASHAAQLVAAGQFPNTASGQSQAFAAVVANFMAANAAEYPMAGSIIAAAQTLAQQATTQIVANGATHVAVVDVPDIGQTPAAMAANQASPGANTLLAAITAAYNITLMGALQPAIAAGQVVPVDTFSWFDTEVANYQSAGFTVSNTAIACNMAQIEANVTAYATANPDVLANTGLTAAQFGQQAGSSLFCSPQTLAAPSADVTYMFADGVHPTTALHAAFARFVEQQLAAAGIGNAP
jgi:phospholipase/lecithinase/hemolysin